MVLDLEKVSLKREGAWILKDIDWKIRKGEHWVLYGLNGAGKTAILKMMNAYYFPTSGNMTVVGKEFGKTPLGEHLRTKIGFVSSSIQRMFYPADSAYQIILSGAFASIGLYETPTDQMRKKAISLLEKLGCMNYADRSYETLSQGERQRVLIGRALMADPELLILDEPTTGLDFIARESLLKTISDIAEQPNAPTLIYVTHHVEEILPVFNKTLLLRRGEVFASGDTKDMITSSQLTQFFELPVDIIWQNSRPLLSKKTKCTEHL
ncbi:MULTISPECIES: ABC transporter ATP-binding protein [Bacillus]|uniref:Molybdenum ABC transporter ATP-binding protein n=2 Tax=Bacillus TaxID=1386 RepID=A0A0M4G831_9BACI|nr:MULTISPECIES: ABC transporter ATP-binding protein [Bacillus]ALC81290.1 molybdenum ABC transporter ATP-binding protein [Bacillus gobiensis]MBP1080300.1 iron complex transport system ATP-binding protein [Bacillus capparidis]MED1094163.1 ABC transporter ATP-binding protein [Bacillus capparidis]